MSKQSPYWVDLLLDVSPYVIQVIESIIHDNQDDIERSILEFFRTKRLFLNVDENVKSRNVKMLTNGFRYVLRFVSLKLEGYEK